MSEVWEVGTHVKKTETAKLNLGEDTDDDDDPFASDVEADLEEVKQIEDGYSR